MGYTIDHKYKIVLMVFGNTNRSQLGSGFTSDCKMTTATLF